MCDAAYEVEVRRGESDRYGAARYPEPAEPVADARTVDGVPDGVAGAVGVPVSLGSAVPVGGGAEVVVSEVPVEVGVVAGADGIPAVPVALSVAVAVALGGADVPVGLGLGDTGLVAGRGCGACGLFSPGSWGSRKKPMPSPATARTEPAAFCAMRIRRRACTPARSRTRSSASKGVYSWVSRIIRVNSRSK